MSRTRKPTFEEIINTQALSEEDFDKWESLKDPVKKQIIELFNLLNDKKSVTENDGTLSNLINKIYLIKFDYLIDLKTLIKGLSDKLASKWDTFIPNAEHIAVINIVLTHLANANIHLEVNHLNVLALYAKFADEINKNIINLKNRNKFTYENFDLLMKQPITPIITPSDDLGTQINDPVLAEIFDMFTSKSKFSLAADTLKLALINSLLERLTNLGFVLKNYFKEILMTNNDFNEINLAIDALAEANALTAETLSLVIKAGHNNPIYTAEVIIVTECDTVLMDILTQEDKHNGEDLRANNKFLIDAHSDKTALDLLRLCKPYLDKDERVQFLLELPEHNKFFGLLNSLLVLQKQNTLTKEAIFSFLLDPEQPVLAATSVNEEKIDSFKTRSPIKAILGLFQRKMLAPIVEDELEEPLTPTKLF